MTARCENGVAEVIFVSIFVTQHERLRIISTIFFFFAAVVVTTSGVR